MANQLWRERRLAVRRLWATPVFTAFAAISLTHTRRRWSATVNGFLPK
jgi:hypothetical protein